MDIRWQPFPLDVKKTTQIILHPFATFRGIVDGDVYILTTSLGAGGAGYAVADQFTVVGGGGDANGVVLTVDGTGSVLTYSLNTYGTNYIVTAGAATTTTGVGTGFTLNILTVGVDDFDLSPFLSVGSHSMFEANLTFNWNQELSGVNQPQPNQLIELRMQGQILWLGVIESIGSFTLDRGTRSMVVTAKSRDCLNIFKQTKRVSQLYVQMTDYSIIITDIAHAAGLYDEEINVPNTSAYKTAHSNTQLAGISAWEMFTTIMLSMGLSPFIDWRGSLRGADRTLTGRPADAILSDDRVVKVVASRCWSPVSRVRIMWLDPTLTKSIQDAQIVANVTVTLGWFLPYIQQRVWFSNDKTQRATNTWLKVKQNAGGFLPVCVQEWDQDSEEGGVVRIGNPLGLAVDTTLILVALGVITITNNDPDGVVTFGFGSSGGYTIRLGTMATSIATIALLFTLSNIGTGVYEVWGNPFSWVHAKNTSEAFDKYCPMYIDNPVDIENDFITNETHADAVATRELLYRAKEPNKWTVDIVDDPRLEYGDIIQFSDGSQMYVEDFTRDIARDSKATLSVKGFMV